MNFFTQYRKIAALKKVLFFYCSILLLTSLNAQKMYPPDLWYTKDHLWLRKNNDKTVTLGVTYFMQKHMGKIIFFIKEGGNKEGTILEEGEALCEIESIMNKRTIHIPFSGKIVSFNKDLMTFPEEINESPYNEGWIVKINPSEGFKFDGLFLGASEYIELLLR